MKRSTSRARITPVREPTEEQRELLAKTLVAPGGQPLNIFATLAHHPRLLGRFNALGGLFLAKGLLPERERELVILRVAYRTGSVYEFGQHTVIGRRAGLTDDEIRAVTRPLDDGAWVEDDKAVLAFTDSLIDTDTVEDAEWAAVAARWDEPRLLELVLLVGFYRMVAGLLNAVGVEREPDVPGWPTGG
jgi:alkylhydroperoxidase family enzyme